MKNKRRLISAVMALAMISALAPMSAFADTTVIPDPDDMPNPKPGTANTQVEFSVDPAYTVTIPALVELTETTSMDGYSYAGEDVLTAEGVCLEPDQKIVVSISSDDGEGFLLENEKKTDYTVPYEVLVEGSEGSVAVEDGGKVAEFETNEAPTDSMITFAVSEDTEILYAGKYTDTVVFDIAVESFVPVTSLNVNGNINLGIGGTHTVTATVNPQNATNKTLEWEKNRDDVDLNVSEDTLSCTITGKKTGLVYVTVRTTDGSGLYETFVVVIEPPAP